MNIKTWAVNFHRFVQDNYYVKYGAWDTYLERAKPGEIPSDKKYNIDDLYKLFEVKKK